MIDQVRRAARAARRRLILTYAVDAAPWTCLAGVAVSLAAVLAVKLWPPAPWGMGAWAVVWLAGGVAAGLGAAAAWGAWRSRRLLEAAIELDRRCGLKERVSSVLALDERRLASEAGRALTDDAARWTERVDVAAAFPVRPGWRPLVPLAAALVVAGAAWLVPEAAARRAGAAAPEEAEQVRTAAERLKKRIAEQRRRAAEEGLEDAEQALRELEEGLEQLRRGPEADRRQALVRVNELAAELERRRQELGDAERLRRQLERLAAAGEQDPLRDALRRGDFREAMRRVEQLRARLADAELSDEERAAAARRLEELARRLAEAAAAQEAARRALERQLEQAVAAGDAEAVRRLQEKLDRLASQAASPERLGELADQLDKAAEALDAGQWREADDALGELAQALDDLGRQADDLETMEQALAQIAEAKRAMNCSECRGAG